MTAANSLKAWRQANGATQRDVAALAGLSVTMVSRVEAGTRQLSPKGKIRLARALGVPLGELFPPAIEAAA
ncbi:helix-turn-helix domain-containing protein [Microlunatus sp. Y2014]|uniref:helix-turn-helix domain-containing protein n=1 Tax=Microlunatus sp. Y2014 TaxID=3418488 RepID=UPI003DA6E873